MARRAVVIGGSLGGLTAAVLLREVGFEVTVHERSTQLADRGAGIVAHPETLRLLLSRRVATLDGVSIPCGNLRYIDRHSTVVSEERSGYRFTSWYALYARLLALLPSHSLRFGEALAGLSQHADGVTAQFDGGGELQCDVLVCADGISSTARGILLPGVGPVYSGYIGWRGTVPFGNVDRRLIAELGPHITYQLLEEGHILAYPIPDSRGLDAVEGSYLNWIWYRRAPAGPDLAAAMTDNGGRQHALSVPPGAVATSSEADLRTAAATLLSRELAALVLGTPKPFIQRVVDVQVPQMAFGRICLIGDAAFVARPHAAAGTAKAAADGWALAGALEAARDVPAALLAWEPGQIDLGVALVRRSRELGEEQFAGRWLPGDPSLLFGLREPGDSCFDAAASDATRS